MSPGDRPSSPSTRTFGRSPSSGSTDPFGRSPLGYLLGRCTLTEVYRYPTSAADPEAAGSVRLDPDLEEPSLCNWGANRLPNRKLTEPKR
ncbi:hypothetical protein P7L53_10525 [Thermoleptolyngbya sichuanensis XZ-Cy5]|uniref:hypothetical protein n=1 Tax=Thermoleptolyngbya sichuanensis TaxID=2885951 RepID=UPI00240D2E6D|nr:hypothetical protein [Thermoleptolyngbya sichuanensis]MDG2616680.1 hypothetical protein [Thermoleptolyngbya sichuanensis XZ-Cy5]